MMGQEFAWQTRNKQVKKLELKKIRRFNKKTLLLASKNREPLIEEHKAAALNTAEDQFDGRFLREPQRNEDIDIDYGQ